MYYIKILNQKYVYFNVNASIDIFMSTDEDIYRNVYGKVYNFYLVYIFMYICLFVFT